MRILILTSCTGKKKYKTENRLIRADFEHLGSPAFLLREKQLEHLRSPARDMYAGRQHLLLMKGVDHIRAACSELIVDVKIISAGYGLLDESTSIVPYEMTFNGMKTADFQKWIEFLDLPRKTLSTLLIYDRVIFLLGKEYLRAIQLPDTMPQTAELIFFTGKGASPFIPKGPNIHPLILDNKAAARLRAGGVALKGRVFEILGAETKARGSGFFTDMMADPRGLVEFVENYRAGPDTSPGVSAKPRGRRSRASADMTIEAYDARVIRLPDSWLNKTHRKHMRYFIPEWNDLVNPAYDFLNDAHPPGTGDDYALARYAHQIYQSPPYDGILVSKVIIEAQKSKRTLIEHLGIHRYLRVPRQFPIMGDCGAFGYIAEDVPPYETNEILEYYQSFDFDYGVSIDHLIVNAVIKKDLCYVISPDGQREEVPSETWERMQKNGQGIEVKSPRIQAGLFDDRPRLWKTEAIDESEIRRRYDLTVNNARDFIEGHQKGGYRFIPIGAVQGWTPDSYADAVREYQHMGYTYLALGGLVRTPTAGILEVLEAVHKVLKHGVDLHLFGVARPEALARMHQLGVTSIDSASFLRRAWLGATSNYFTPAEKFAAIRIPQAEKSPKARKIIRDGKATADEIRSLEERCLRLVRGYDQGRVRLEDVLESVLTYDALIDGNRKGHDELIRKTLEAMPWKTCGCEICREAGVEVIIFRGNNRNRRRGFHNTRVFYDQFCRTFEERSDID
jgi:hypothetical protein